MSDKKFDDKIREALEGHEPDVQPNWGRMKERIAAAAAIGAIGVDVAGSRIISQLSIGVAVVVGAASMWFAQQYILPANKVVEDRESIEQVSNQIDPEIGDITSIAVLEVGNGFVKTKEEEISNSTKTQTISNKSTIINNKSDKNQESDEFSIIPEMADVLSEKLLDNNNPSPEHTIEVDLPFEASVKEACVGVEVDFKLDVDEQNMSFLWNFGDGSFSSEAFPSHVYNEEGIFDVTLSVRSPGAGAIQTRTIRNLIEVHSQPEAKMNIDLPRIVIAGALEVELNDETVDSNSSTWVVDGKASSNNFHNFTVPGTYNLNLIASNKFGCQDHAFEKIEFGDRQLLRAPARFSPDGDGRYDSFMPFGLYRLVDDWELVISDEHGKEIYSTKEFNSPWDGTDLSGELAGNGEMFYWTVVCTDHCGVQRLYTDAVRVER
ncbi:MAG: hypothetical protein COA49_08545 [Bacteroidetes bacterium]|nr:MAG: hypothetical protein COA49_08545 [Bacteroidota bacterium]